MTTPRINGCRTFASHESFSTTRTKLLPQNAKKRHNTKGIVTKINAASTAAFIISHILIYAPLIIP